MKKKSLAVALAIMFFLSTKPALANSSAPAPGGPNNENVLKCLLLPVPLNIYYCAMAGIGPN